MSLKRYQVSRFIIYLPILDIKSSPISDIDSLPISDTCVEINSLKKNKTMYLALEPVMFCKLAKLCYRLRFRNSSFSFFF